MTDTKAQPKGKSEEPLQILALTHDDVEKIFNALFDAKLTDVLGKFAEQGDKIRASLVDAVKDHEKAVPELVAEALIAFAQGDAFMEALIEALPRAAEEMKGRELAAAEAAKNDAAASAQDRADAAAAEKRRSEKQAVKARKAKLDAAREDFLSIFGGPDRRAFSIEEAAARVGKIRIDNGGAFNADFAMPLTAADLVKVDDRSFRLKSRVEVPGTLADAFTLRGVVADFGGGLALRCEITPALPVGAGRSADLPANSLIFRVA